MKEEIEAAYHRSGNNLGWRFLYGPEATLVDAEIAFIGLNPGDSKTEQEHDVFATAPGKSAYFHEKWGTKPAGQHKLQVQVQALFHRLDVEPHYVLAGNIVPFRSQGFKSLKNRQECLRFGRNLWRKVLDRAKPRLIVCMGIDAGKQLLQVLQTTSKNSVPVGWGKIHKTRHDFDGGTLVKLPHLSRIAIMKREASQHGLDRLFASASHL